MLKLHIPCLVRRSTMPASRGSSGPTTTSPISCCRHADTTAAKPSEASTAIDRLTILFNTVCAAAAEPEAPSDLALGIEAISAVPAAVPPLPGAANTVRTAGDRDSFQAMVCSRPPEPMTNTFSSGDAGTDILTQLTTGDKSDGNGCARRNALQSKHAQQIVAKFN